TLLSQDAYYRAQAHYSIQRNHTNQIANVTFSIDPGKPAELREVQFAGSTSVPVARLRKIADWHRGMHLTATKVQHGLYLIHRFYTKAGHLEATSNVESRTYDPAHNAETLAVKIVPGPVVKVHVEGARISSSNLKKILPVYTEGLTDNLSLDDGSRKLVNYFEQKGYFSAKARWRRIAHPNEVDITYIVDLGRQAAFQGFDFRGNRSIPSSELAPLVTLEPQGFFTHLHGVFSQEMADQSAQTIANYYHSKGFLQAQVHPVLGKKQGGLFVTFNVREGAETRVGKLTFKGVSKETDGQLRPLLQAAPGHPYSPALIGKDRNTILTYFANHGYESATVVPHVSPPDLHEVGVEYEITPGRQLKIQRVAILGNEHTRTGVIERQLTLQPGQPMSQEKMFDSQRQLYDLGLFNSVEIAPQNPAGAETQKTLLVNVEEARRWTLGYGFGLDVQRLGTGSPQGQFGVSPRLSLDVTRINVGGRDQTFSLRSRVSDLETGGEVSYLFPHFLNHRDLTLHIDGTADRTRDVLTFTSFIRQASLSIEKQYSPSTFLVGRYNYRFVTASNLKIQ
ncbi:MAG TPA: POTRA domain-containing protein, partial [Terriglobia bacterium]|nr:POTRA domain-containing protein [Terriglobia bacterium]